MAGVVTRIGRIIYLNGPDTGTEYDNIFPANYPIRFDEIVLIAAAVAAVLQVFADPNHTASKQIAELLAPAGYTDDFILGSYEICVPDSYNGLSVHMTGAGAKAELWLA